MKRDENGGAEKKKRAWVGDEIVRSRGWGGGYPQRFSSADGRAKC